MTGMLLLLLEPASACDTPTSDTSRMTIMMPLVRAFVCSWYVGVYIYIKLVLILPVGSPLHHCP